MSDSNQQRHDEADGKLFRHFFVQMCQEDDIDEAKKPFVTLAYFLGWLGERMSMTTDPAEICDSLNIHMTAWEHVREIVGNGSAVELVAPVWHMITMADRPKPVHKLARLTLNCMLIWEDGRVMPISSLSDELMLAPGGHFSDGFVAMWLQKQARVMQHVVADKTLDGLHDEADNYRGTTPEDPFEVMMGLLIKHGIHQLHAQLREPVMRYVRLAQGMIRPVIPAQVLAKLQAQRQEWARQQNQLPAGGFNS